MAIETKEEFLERILKEEKPKCPHCDQEMNLWEVPPVTFSDGLGWGVPYLFICFNDECDLYKEGFQPVLSRKERLEYHDTAINHDPAYSV